MRLIYRGDRRERREELFLEVKDAPPDSVFENCHIEVDEKTDFPIPQTKIGH